MQDFTQILWEFQRKKKGKGMENKLRNVYFPQINDKHSLIMTSHRMQNSRKKNDKTPKPKQN